MTVMASNGTSGRSEYSLKLFTRRERTLLNDVYDEVKDLDNATFCKFQLNKSDTSDFIRIIRELKNNKLLFTATMNQVKFEIAQKTTNQQDFNYFCKEIEYRIEELRNYKGLSEKDLQYASEHFEKNMISIPTIPLTKQIIQHLIKQNFLSFVLYELLLVLNGKIISPLFSIGIQVPFHCSDVFTERWKSSQMRKSIAKNTIQVHLLRNGKWVVCNSQDIYPGDFISIKKMKDKSTIPCDILLMHGRCLMDEASLNGESCPVIKDSAGQYPDNFAFNNGEECKSSMLYSGTTLLSSESDAINHSSAEMECSGIVLRTGNETLHGQIVTSTLESHSKNSSKQLGKQLMPIIVLMGLIGIIGGIYHFRHSMIKNNSAILDSNSANEVKKKSLYKIVVQSLLIMASAIPSDVQVNIFMALNKGLNHLLGKHIFVSEPTSILNAYNCNVFCFDKTGTLTQDDIYIHGIYDVTSNQLCTKPSLLPNILRMACLACNSLNCSSKIKSSLSGDKLELALFNFVHGAVKVYDNTGRIYSADCKKSYGSVNDSVTVKKVFGFSSSLKRMSIIITSNSTQYADKAIVICKGAPEEIFKRIINNNSEYQSIFQNWSIKGFRVLSVAYKIIDFVDNKKIDEISRDEVENDLHLIGFIIAANNLKEHSQEVVDFILNGQGSVRMVTGDNLLTAAAVCDQLKIIDLNKTWIITDKPDFQNDSSAKVLCKSLSTQEEKEFSIRQIESLDSTFDGHFAIEGKTLDHLNFDASIVNACKLFARTSPNQKGLICRSLRQSGNWPIMVGDGTNDILAMRESAAGISLASNVNLEESKQKNEKKNSPIVTPESSTNKVGIFQMMRNNFNSVEEDKVVQPSTIASSFATSSHSPFKILEILRQSQSTLAIVRFCIIISLVYTIIIFSFDLMMLSNDIIFTDAQLMFEGVIIQVLFSMVIASKVSEKIINTRNLKKRGKICSCRMAINIISQSVINVIAVYIVKTYIVSTIASQCIDDQSNKSVSPCKAIYHYLFMFLEITTILFAYPGSQFMTPLFDTTLFKLIICSLMAVTYMLINGITFGLMQVVTIALSESHVNLMLQIFIATVAFKFLLFKFMNPYI